MTTYPKILSVTPLAGYQLQVTFHNHVTKVYDCANILQHPAFALLRDPASFRSVQVDAGGYGVRWNDELDLSEAELWRLGQSVQSEDDLAFLHIQQVKAQSPQRVTLDEMKREFE